MSGSHPAELNVARRRWMQGTVASAAATLTGLPSALAGDPIQRNGTPRFKFSLAAYSYRSLLQGEDARMSLEDFIDDCAEFQLEGTELTSYYFPQPITEQYLLDLKWHCFRLGLSISGTAVRNDFAYPEGSAERQQWLDHVKQWVDYAAILGAPVIRVFAGQVRDGMAPAEAHRLIVSGLEECCDYAGTRGIHLALENHGGPTATATGLLSLVRDVQSPWFGVNLDTGNFHSEDVYGDLARLAPYALNVQVKVVVSGPDRQKRPSDFRQLARILRRTGYRGFVVLEYEESGDPREECRRYLDELRSEFAA